MAKIMIFIDGTWIYSNLSKLAGTAGTSDLHIDYGLLPTVLAAHVQEALRLPQADIVRTHFFGSYPVDYDPRDEEAVQRTREFFSLLKEEFHYETELYPVSFRGNRLRKIDRPLDGDFEPREKSVDIALASSLVYHGAVGSSYDVAIVVIGDRDYVPALQAVRRMGRRVAIASIRESCAAVYSDPRDQSRVKDGDIIWLNDLVEEIQLRYEPRMIECQSDLHEGERFVWTTFRPRRHQTFYCDDCRRKFLGGHPAHAPVSYAPSRILPASDTSVIPGDMTDAVELHGAPDQDMNEEQSLHGDAMRVFSEPQPGAIYSLKSEQYYGFLQARTGKQYYFNAGNLRGMTWGDLVIGLDVEFDILREPAEGRAGAVSALWKLGE
jgi:hypothetical protein